MDTSHGAENTNTGTDPEGYVHIVSGLKGSELAKVLGLKTLSLEDDYAMKTEEDREHRRG